METIIGKHWHHLPADEVIDLLEGDREKGLDLFESGIAGRSSAERDRGNKGKGPLARFLLQFHQPLIYILLASGIVTALLREWVDAGVIFGVVLVKRVRGFLRSRRRSRPSKPWPGP